MENDAKSLFYFGVNPVVEKLRSSPQEVFEIMMVSQGQPRVALRAIDAEAKRQGVPVRYVETGVLDRLADGARHQGVVAKVLSYAYNSFSDLVQELPSASGHDRILVLDGLTDPRNFGALLRSAEGAGVRHVVIPKNRAVGVTPTVVKSSAGAVHYLKVSRVSNLRRAILTLKQRGYWAIGLDAEAPASLYDKGYPEKLVVVLGAEGTGIRPLVKQECDFLVSIPMRGRIASLNVAVAGGIFLYELLRQSKQG
ncbi:23S rRNA (guanosine(2251)-2'-O)-methyltransferase RlmB [bacterium]|nr:MAG: 23S rRNA (guanosine(2251)-2'-O)-methyltransferase RlmB [bacterium]